MKLRPQTGHFTGALAPAPIPFLGVFFRWGARRRAHLILFISVVFLFAGCGVQAPPQPPRVETPARIKDLRAIQIGRSFYLDFTLPVLATDGERLTKPLGIKIFRAITPPDQPFAPPSTDTAPWVTILSSELPHYLSNDRFRYPSPLSDQAFRQQQNSTFAFAVVAFTRGFRSHPHQSALSNIAQTRLIDVSEPVTNLTVNTTQTALKLSWTQPAQTLAGQSLSKVAAYRVYASRTGKPGSFRVLADTQSTQYNDPNFQFGQAYYFRVTTVSTMNSVQAESQPSQTLEITPKDTFPPAVPRRLTALYTAGAVDLLWNANTDSDLAGYNVYRKIEGGSYARVNKQLLSTPIFHDTSAAPGQIYQYAVTAVDLSGNESAKSQPVNVSTHLPGQS
ncbi:MAG: hypothetical protein M1423_09080 [Acidobacteria bacterium]|nr:hypothetical protein [Acidobacteriota bacterium]